MVCARGVNIVNGKCKDTKDQMQRNECKRLGIGGLVAVILQGTRMTFLLWTRTPDKQWQQRECIPLLWKLQSS
jgi:hypothetical protein